MPKEMTTAEAAVILDVSRRRVLELIRLGTLEATKFGRDWQVDQESVEYYKNSPRKAGPKKTIHKSITKPGDEGKQQTKKEAP